MDAGCHDPEPLLQEAPWVRALALQLCADAHAAEDAAQDALAAALRRPPRDPKSMRAFLARTVRNALSMARRGERRRVQRERRAAAEGVSPDTGDLVARAELHRELVEAVLALPAVPRELVLRHYYEGEDVAALARRLSTTPDAVRAQLRRTRERLRTRLERGGGATGAFALLVAATRPPLPPAPAPAAAGAGAGAAAAHGGATLAIALAAGGAVALLATAWLASRAADAPPPGTGGPPVHASPVADAPAQPRHAAREPAPPTERPVALKGLVTGLHPLVPWTTTITLRAAVPAAEPAVPPRVHGAELAVAADGSFAAVLPPWCREPAATVRVAAHDPGYLPLDRTLTLASELPAADAEVELAVTPATTVAGRVVDARGDGVPAVWVGAFLPNVPRPPRPQSDTWVRAVTSTDAGGRYRLQVPAAGDTLLLAAPLRPGDGAARHRDDLMPAAGGVALRWGEATLAPDLRVPDASCVTGDVVAGDGVAVPGVVVTWFPDMDGATSLYDRELGNLICWPGGGAARLANATTDAAGRFRLPVPAACAGRCVLADASGAHESLVAPLATLAPQHVTLRLARIAVVRVHSAGRPVDGAFVRIDGVADHYVPVDRRRRTDANGEVRLLRDRVEPVRLLVQRAGDDELVVPLDDAASATAPQLVELPAAAMVRVQLFVDAAVPVHELAVAWRADADSAWRWYPTLRRGDVVSPFELELPARAGELSVGPAMLATGPAALLVGTTVPVASPRTDRPLHVAVEQGGRVRVHATDANGRFVGGIVSMRGPTDSSCTLGGQQPGETPPIPPGTYQVIVSAFGEKAQRREVAVPRGVIVDLYVRFP